MFTISERLFPTNRRTFLIGGAMTAAATPLLAATPVQSDTHDDAPIWMTGQRVLPLGDSVVGISSLYTNMPIRLDNSESTIVSVDNESVGLSDVLYDLVAASAVNGDMQRPSVDFNRDNPDFLDIVKNIQSREQDFIVTLTNSNLYWVEINPWFLVAIGRVATHCVIPFVQGVFSATGALVAQWAWNQISQAQTE